MKRVLLILVALLALSSIGTGGSVAAENPSEKTSDRPIYRYVGPNGTQVFTNDPSRIPAEFRSSAKVVELPLAIKLPEPPPPSKPESASFSTRIGEWIQSQPPANRMIIVGMIPMLILSLWLLNFLRKRSDSAFVKLSLRMGMMAILVLSAYLCYFIFIRTQTVKLIGSVPGGSGILSSPKQKAEDLKKDEADRLNTIEGIANQK